MVRRVVVDSSANLFVSGTQDIVSVPMKVRVGEREFPDDENLDVGELIEAFSDEAAESSTSCPNIAEWTSAFAGADEIVALALTSKISGGFNSAQAAAKHYLFDHPEVKVFVLDSLTTGPELELLAQHANELAQSDMDFDDLTHELRRYASRTHLMFSLERIDNFVRNGRVSPIVAKVAGVLGVRIVGQASEECSTRRAERSARSSSFSRIWRPWASPAAACASDTPRTRRWPRRSRRRFARSGLHATSASAPTAACAPTTASLAAFSWASKGSPPRLHDACSPACSSLEYGTSGAFLSNNVHDSRHSE